MHRNFLGQKFGFYLVCTTLMYVFSSCSTRYDTDVYYELTEPLQSLNLDIAGDPTRERTYSTGELVAILQVETNPREGVDGLVMVSTQQNNDIGWVDIKRLRKTSQRIEFPKNQVFSSNFSEVYFARNNNNEYDDTYLDSYRFVSIFPSNARSGEIYHGSTKVISQDFGPTPGYKVLDASIPLEQFGFGKIEFEFVSQNSDGKKLGARRFRLFRDSTIIREIHNGETESFSYSANEKSIVINRFFGFSKDDEDNQNYQPDLNRYIIDGLSGYSFAAKIDTDPSKTRRSVLPLVFRVLKDGVELAQFPLRQFELTPQYDEKTTIVDEGSVLIVYCTPAFESAPRTLIFNKRTGHLFDVWQILRENGVNDFHSFIDVSVDSDLVLRETSSRFDSDVKTLETYAIDLDTEKLTTRAKSE